ncbi:MULTISPECIES: nitroreductase family protein [unclassified Pseudomonas]|uniref:nitroreductase family protein n=1 Tax=unclassified Pseudomonas TaxID=196821 RepID=UPI0013315609|nr:MULTISPECIES: nitroreductase family protein [unclassified Pseudomonas]
MNWPATTADYGKLSSELIFQYHKLEKGLCMPGPKRFFGEQPAIATITLINRWNENGFKTANPIYFGAIETLRAYRDFIANTPLPSTSDQSLKEKIETILAANLESPNQFKTPIPISKPNNLLWEEFSTLMVMRRSVRNYLPKKVETETIEECINIANLSPSVCNRQTCKVRIYEDPDQITKLLTFQNGNRGFGHLLSTLLIITSDTRYFFDGSERNQPFIDGGLLSMSLILALQSKGISSCCLNWCVSPTADNQAHIVGGIPDHERIIMYLAIGYPAEGAVVPKSERRAQNEIAIQYTNM